MDTLQFHYRLIFTIIHEDAFTAVMYFFHGISTPRTSATRYHVPNRKILQVATTLESTQEKGETLLVEYYNQQQIFIWVINNINILSVQGNGYTEWELHEARERIILINSSYSDIFGKIGVPNITITRSLNVILPPLKFSSLKHLWDPMGVEKNDK